MRPGALGKLCRDAVHGAAIIAALSLLVGCSDPEFVVPPPPPADVKAPPGSWTSFGRDLSHSRANPDEQLISRDNVGQLTEKWRIDAPGVTSTAAVWDGIVYFADWAGGVYARRAADGSEVWTQTLEKGFSSSPCVTRDRIYLADRVDSVYALERETGAIVWRHHVESTPHARLWSSPTVSGNVLVIGLAGIGTQMAGTPFPDTQLDAFRGAVVGLDAGSGSPLWRFETTRGPGGEEYGAGVSVWSSAAIDEELGLVFIGTGNSYFPPASPYSDSLLALRRDSGELVWHRQFTPDDAFRSANPSGGPDFDVGAAPNLFEAGGRRLVGVGDKGGIYHTLDRATGELIWEVSLTMGSSTGGVVAPAAVSDGVIYVSSNQGLFESRVFALAAVDGKTLWQKSFPAYNFGAPALANGVLFVGSASEDMAAFSIDDGTELWKGLTPYGKGGGFSISGGLMFIGSGFRFYQDAAEPIPGALNAYGP